MFIKGHEVKGSLVDEETRCTHYHTEQDRIAIKFFCCQSYYPCYQCHEEHGCGQPAVWPKKEFNQKAILCGTCGTELTITQYMESGYHCPKCNENFNPGCHFHGHLYFET